MLKNSARNCTLTRSALLKVLTSEKSQLRKPGPRNMLRPAVPKSPPGCRSTRSTGIGPVVEKLEIDLGSPIRFQRSLNSAVPLESLLKSTALNGCPPCSVTIELTCQSCNRRHGDLIPGSS